ncbi:MAG: hypothetical protein QOJ32_2161 [Frankiaceae bacterium]|nr:hypothetical protein [Frankiaceae bacterium]
MISLGLILLVVAGGTGVQLGRRLPADTLMPAAQLLAVPGTAPLPWPRGGQATVDVDGVGMTSAQQQPSGIPMGSVAKIMTAYVILSRHPLPPRTGGPMLRVTAADEASYRHRARSRESLLPVRAGEQLTERQALEALLVPSANNAADLLAEWDAGTIAQFVVRLNDEAGRLGLTATRYSDASGFRASTVSSATDQVRLAERALSIPAFAEIVKTREVVLPLAGRMRNYNALLDMPGVIGVKTGSTPAAGGNIVFAATRRLAGSSVTIVGAVLGQHVGERSLQALAAALDAAKGLLNAIEAEVRSVVVVRAGTAVGHLRTAWGPSVEVYAGGSVTELLAPGAAPTATFDPVGSPGRYVGAQVGRLIVRTGENQVDVPVLLSQPLRNPSLGWRLRRGL